MTENGERGTGCPKCGCLHCNRVSETRRVQLNGETYVIRIRECRYCDNVYRTREILDEEVKLPSRKKKTDSPEEPAPRENPTKPGSGINPFLQK